MTIIEKSHSNLEPLYWSKQAASIKEARILVVDDSDLIRELIGACLMTEGYNNICFAENGQDALEVISLELPDLIILDLEMPVMDGFELCQLLRSAKATSSIPILIQSGRDTASDITRAFEYGASDMIVKPIKKFEIIARAKVHLEHRFYVAELTDFHDRVTSELEQARQLQLDICPSKMDIDALQEKYALKIGWHFEPSSELGGDIGGLYPVNDTKIAFYLADFSGHGVAAALNTFRLHSWLASESKLYENPDQLLTKLGSFLNTNLKTGCYATMLFGCIDLQNNEIVYASAGIQPPLLQGSDPSSEFTMLNSNGMPLGLSANWEYERKTAPFEKGAKIMLYSDALVEVEASTGEMLGEEGLSREVAELWVQPFSHTEKIKKIAENFQNRLVGQAPDDLTIIYLENSGVNNGR